MFFNFFKNKSKNGEFLPVKKRRGFLALNKKVKKNKILYCQTLYRGLDRDIKIGKYLNYGQLDHYFFD